MQFNLSINAVFIYWEFHAQYRQASGYKDNNRHVIFYDANK